jgi:hypothetical protein
MIFMNRLVVGSATSAPLAAERAHGGFVFGGSACMRGVRSFTPLTAQRTLMSAGEASIDEF